jgi:hypothetical protein
MFRGLRIPSSYLPTGTDESERTYSDGKTTTALIQEWRFNQYCMRLQTMIAEKLDTEFKMFMRWRGVNIDNSLFDLRFNEPQNFAKYRQAEVDQVRIATFTQLEPIPYLSKRFLLERYLDLSEEEMTRNDELWAQENGTVETTEIPAAGGFQQFTRVLPSNVSDYSANQLPGRVAGGKWIYSNAPTSQQPVLKNRPNGYYSLCQRGPAAGKSTMTAQTNRPDVAVLLKNQNRTTINYGFGAPLTNLESFLEK